MLEDRKNVVDFIFTITERARAAFYLIVSEKVLEGIGVNQDEYPFVREVLNKCWNWLAGQNITPEELWTCLESEEEFTISDVEWKVKDNKEKLPIIKTITVALMYVIWRAFEKDGEGLPESIEEVDEGAIKYLVEYANECVGFKAIWIDELKDYMVKNYKISENEYGEPIEKNIMTEVAKCFK